ncbi:MAG: thioether cross-link-forming SCIFF peptide maturase [Oscillospiraceae bacterium]|jgi:uncharacterized protein|nr:thioether cross-link-forming SCIFF peptide maturase [Oscillospiraceae bacterium]
MVHAFEALGEKWAYDVEGGALLQVSDLAFDALTRLSNSGWNREAARSSLRAIYSERDADQALDELFELRADGQIDTPDDADESLVAPPGVIKALCLHAAHDCNLRCRYCFADQGAYNHSSDQLRMPASVGKAALDFLIRHSGNRRNLEVDFFGGEPLMNFGAVKEIVEYGRLLEASAGKRFAFTITTNAVGLTDDIARWINLEMDNVVLSIDGRECVHDRMRPTANGRGSYLPSLEGARRVVESRGDKSYYVRGTFTSYNIDFTSDALALVDAGFKHISVEPVVAPPEAPYALTNEHIPAILQEYDRLADAYLKRLGEGRPFSFFHFVVDIENGPCLRKRLMGCGAGNEYAAVTPDGKLYPCHQFVGRVGFEMGDVLTGAFDADAQRRFAANHILNKPVCRSCWAKYMCSGGCAANAHAMNGSIDKPYELACALQKKRLEIALAISGRNAGADQADAV